MLGRAPSGSTYEVDDQGNDKNGSEYAATDVHGIPLLSITLTGHWTTRTISCLYATARSEAWILLMGTIGFDIPVA